MNGLTLAQQAAQLTAMGFACTTSRSELTAEGQIRPSQVSDCYNIALLCPERRPPRTYVTTPLRAGWENAPHLYPSDKAGRWAGLPRLCLFDRPWRHGTALKKTIVPWAAEWLVYYEVWLTTGQWLGGGTRPTGRQRDTMSRYPLFRGVHGGS